MDPAKVIGEIGINHNGDLDIAKALCTGIAKADGWAAKFQMRTPELCVPMEVRNTPRKTPWGEMTYFEYKNRIEFSLEQYQEIDRHCREINLPWFASVWDTMALARLMSFSPPAIKIASASLADHDLLRECVKTNCAIIMSTGMSTLDEIDAAVRIVSKSKRFMLMHSVSEYPTPEERCNLSAITTLQQRYPGVQIGYSGHEMSLEPSIWAYVLGATVIERHVTFDREAWGTDHKASLTVTELGELVTALDRAHLALGSGKVELTEWEKPARQKLRGS